MFPMRYNRHFPRDHPQCLLFGAGEEGFNARFGRKPDTPSCKPSYAPQPAPGSKALYFIGDVGADRGGRPAAATKVGTVAPRLPPGRGWPASVGTRHAIPRSLNVMDTNHPQRLRLSTGTEIAYRTAGSPEKPPILLLHGFPSSSRSFRKLLPRLSHHAHLIAPDLPGFGVSELLPTYSFSAFADAVAELLDHLHIGPRYIYLHDFGAPVGLEIAMRAPKQMLGLIIQNANAHETGQGEEWAATKAFWRDPTVENEAAATAHLTLEGTRDQYTARVPSDIAARIDPRVWEEDWRVMQLPGRMAMQRALVADYGRYTATFSSIAMFLAKHQPTALMIWGRHDAFFDLSETLSWMRALPRMEAHILDAGHFALETHAPAVVRIMTDFLARASGTSAPQ